MEGLMLSRAVRSLSVAAASALTLTATAAAASGPPPPPTSANGNPVQLVTSGIPTPTSFAFSAGTMFVGDGGSSESGPPNGGVWAVTNGSATKLPGPAFAAGVAWRKGTLYVSAGTVTASATKWQLLAWSGWNGTSFTKQKVIWTAPKKLDGLNGIAFGPDRRLYVGVDLGLTDGNDHGLASTPYVYDILSFKLNGKGLRVFATGIRQPWQFAFAPGSKSPFVSDLGQDSGANNPPDFLLKVKQGDDYGFPECNWTKKKACKSFAKPFKVFSPHTDVMGLAIIGKRLYMSEFGKQQVGSMPLHGGAVTPLLTGFAAPIVGLAAHGGWIYVGELTGQVFRVKV
jgi:glucose/arabinose dehydrogenase